MTSIPVPSSSLAGNYRFGGLSPLAPWVFQFEGVTMGDPRGDILVDTINGLDMPDVRVEAADKVQDHGGLIVAEWLKPRIIQIAGPAPGNSAAARQAIRLRMGKAFAPKAEDRVLSFAVDDGSYRVVFAKPTKFSFPSDRAFAVARTLYAVELQAADPRIYDDTPTVIDFPPGDSSTGVTYPLTYPISYGGGPSGFGLATNEGTIDTPPVVRLYGPATNPFLANRTVDDVMAFDFTIPAGQFLEVDFAAKTVLLNGDPSASRYYSLAGGRWAGLAPGDNTLQFVASGIDGNTDARVTFRSAWSAI